MLPIIILLPLVLGTTLVSWLKQFSRGVTALGAIAVSLSSFLLLLSQAPAVFNGTVITQTWSWLPQLGIDFSFRLDALGMLFALLISGIGTLIYIYAYYYLSPKNSLSKLYFLLMLFIVMLGISLSNNLLILLIFGNSLVFLPSCWLVTEQLRSGSTRLSYGSDHYRDGRLIYAGWFYSTRADDGYLSD